MLFTFCTLHWEDSEQERKGASGAYDTNPFPTLHPHQQNDPGLQTLLGNTFESDEKMVGLFICFIFIFVFIFIFLFFSLITGGMDLIGYGLCIWVSKNSSAE